MNWREIEAAILDALQVKEVRVRWSRGEPFMNSESISVEMLARELAYRLDSHPSSCSK